ncbi:Serine/threonine-protein kinase [Cocos nucifera]|uniref:non-specific serine/threonine protein kinase n=1 Tax=Cocos nucifera TaxID=13894 RepID=A0A8K0N476_COCNU|nr:Serine/threonine-protein kinase [Cocos nucifera]
MLSSRVSPSIGGDTLTPAQPLADGQELISIGERFILGFFSPIQTNNRYIGIWYKVSPPTIVWVANRQHPISECNGSLSITANGTLIITDQNSKTIWSSGSSGPANPVAQLLDDGNFIVKEANVPGSFAWQSSDFPSDTLLPGMKLGWNLTSGLNRNLTSWTSPSDPAPGPYSLVLDLHGDPQIILWAGSNKLGRSGPWIGQRFSGNPDIMRFKLFILEFVMKNDEVFYMYNTTSTSIIARFTVNYTGVVQRLVWHDDSHMWSIYFSEPKDPCDYVSQCGAYGVCNADNSPICSCLRGFKPRSPTSWDFRDGCVRMTELDCRNGTDGFVTTKEVKLPDTSTSTVYRSMGLDECRAACLRNCSCMAYASAYANGTGCIMWTTELTDTRVYFGGQDLYVRLAAINLDKDRGVLLNWQTRYNIIEGIAQGLLYLHRDSRLRIIHRDLKASNIFLDKDMNPKISDFGLARIFKEDETALNTRRVVGTYGYMSPEYAMDGIFSVKSDVFSFGVLVLEIISGRKNRGVSISEYKGNLLAHAWSLWMEGNGLELVDELISNSIFMVEAMNCIKVGLLCVQESPKDRPTMSSVVLMLGNRNTSLPDPHHPGFFPTRACSEIESSKSKMDVASINELSVTTVEGR